MNARPSSDHRSDQNLVSLLSHDLRSPLGPLTLAVSNLADGVHPAEETQGLARIALAQTDRLRRLIDAALIASGREPPLHPELLAMEAVVHEARAVFEAAGGTVVVRDMPHAIVSADHDGLRDAVAGLMEVAAGEEWASVECSLASHGGIAALTISVADLDHCASALSADRASDSPSAFGLAATRIVEHLRGGVELIDDGIVVSLPQLIKIEVA